ncbi:MAG: fibronectin type III domain-containing protein [Bacteroidales bacterium]|nr:fibronectin type III domain-containing protein [Bacteroidales bacterium]
MKKSRKIASVLLLALAVVFAVGCVKKDPTTDIKMKDVTDITASTAVVHAKASASGGAEIAERGFMYDDKEPAHGTRVRCGSGTGEFEATITGLEPATEYMVLAYIIDGNGDHVGTHYIKFTTLSN